MMRKHRGRTIKPWSDCNGYLVVYICGDGRREAINVHRLVAFAFRPEREGCNDVNHIDGVKSNNSAVNLEWVTRTENMEHAQETGLCDKRLRIRATPKDGSPAVEYASASDAARALGNVSKSGNISSAATGKLKTAYGCSWAYL